MSYSRQEQAAIFTRLMGKLLSEPTAQMLSSGAPTEEQRLSHVSHQQFDIDPNTRADLRWDLALVRNDYINIVPIEDQQNEGGLMMIMETEFTATALPGPPHPVTAMRERFDPIVVKTYTERFRPYGPVTGQGSFEITEDDAFRQVLFRMENKILLDPPPPYLQEARRKEAADRNVQDPSINHLVVGRLGSVQDLLQSLTEIRKSLMSNPAINARDEEEANAIRDRYSIEIEAVTATPEETIIRYSWQGSLGNKTRRAHRGVVSLEVVEEWNRVTQLWEDGFVLRSQDGYIESSYDGEADSTALQPREREIDRLLSYWQLFSSDKRYNDPVRRNLIRLDPEIAAYGINHITVRTEPIDDNFDKVVSINVVYVDHNDYTRGQPHPMTSFTPTRQLKIASRDIIENGSQELQFAKLENELIRFIEIVDEVKELNSNPDSTIEQVLGAIREVTNKLDLVERRINRLTDEQARNTLIAQLNGLREEIDPIRENYESLAAEADINLEELLEEDPSVAADPASVERIQSSPEVQGALATKRFILIDNKSRSVEFKLPLKHRDKGVPVLIIKHLMKEVLDTSQGLDDLFDPDMKLALIDLQRANQIEIMDIMQQISPEEGFLEGLGNSLSRFASGEGQGFDAQVGIVDTPTYLFMYRNGLKAAATEALDYLEEISGNILGTSESTMDVLMDRSVGEIQSEPWEDGDYIYHAYFTNVTREEVNSLNANSYNNFLKKHSEKALRSAVAQIFEYYRRDTTWEIKGNVEEHKIAYGPLLSYQNKIESLEDFTDSKRFTMTIESQSLEDNLQIPPIPVPPPGEISDVDLDAIRKEYTTPVDVLFGQSLKPGARTVFGSIHKVQSPSTRPGSVFKFIIRVRKSMFEEITYPPGSYRTATIGETIEKGRQAARRVSEFVESAPGRAQALVEEGARKFNRKMDEIGSEIESADKAARAGLKWASQNKKEAVVAGAKSAQRLAKKYSRESEIQELTGASRGLPLSAAQHVARRAALLARERDTEIYPATISFPMEYFNREIDDVADLFDKYARDIAIFQLEGGRLDPYISFTKEAERLRTVKAAVRRFLQKNGIPKAQPGDVMNIHFEGVIGARSISKTEEIQDPLGARALGVSYERKGKPKVDLLTGYPSILERPPWDSPKTMHFLAQLADLHEVAMDAEENCFVEAFDLIEEPDEEMFVNIEKFVLPSVVILKSSGAILEVGTPDLMAKKIKLESQIKTAAQKANEDFNLDGSNPISNQLRGKLVRFEKGQTYSIIDPIPKEDLCTLEELYQEFLDKFDFELLFCQYASCIPDIPWPIRFKWDFDFSIPDLPDLPRFDPLAIMIPMIEAALLDLLIAFLCGLVRGILDLIGGVGLASCQDLLDYGAAVWEDAFGSSGTTDKRLLVMKSAAQSLERMNIPVGSYADLADLFDSLALALTPAEMCALLEGSASYEVVAITKSLIDGHYSILKEYLRSESEIQEFFEILGNFVDPTLCAKLANSGQIILGDLCPDGSPSLRQQLENSNATPEEIAEALVAAEKRRASLKDLFTRDPLEGFFEGRLPGPYDAPETSRMSDIASQAVMDNITSAFKIDIANFVPALFSIESKQRQPGEVGYNPIEAAEFEYIKKQMQEKNNAQAKKEQDFLTAHAALINRYSSQQWGGLPVLIDGQVESEEFRRIGEQNLVFSDGTIDPSFFMQAVFHSMHASGDEPGAGQRAFSLTRGAFNTEDAMDHGTDNFRTIVEDEQDISISFRQVNTNGSRRWRWVVNVFGVIYIFADGQGINQALPFLQNKLRQMSESNGRLQKPGPALQAEGGKYQCVGQFKQRENSEEFEREQETAMNQTVAALEAARDSRTGAAGLNLDDAQRRMYDEKIREARMKYSAIASSGGNEPEFFDLSRGQDQMELAEILKFPIRNIIDEALPAPWLRFILQNPDDVITASITNQAAYNYGPLGWNSRVPVVVQEDDEDSDDIPQEYNEPPRREGETTNFEVNIAVPTNIFDLTSETFVVPSNQKILYQEIPFVSSDHITDCYNFHRPSRLLFNNWKGKQYNKQIPDEFLTIRRQVRDIRIHPNEGEKLLRPNAFAELFCNSWQNALQETESEYSSTSVDSYRMALWQKLTGQGTNPDQDEAPSAQGMGAYGNMVEGFLEKISEAVSNSIFFDRAVIEDFGDFISSEFLLSEDKSCYVSNEGVINFDKMRKEMLQKYKASLKAASNMPEKRDFSKPGPLEEGMITQLVLFYVKTYVIEFILKGLFVFSTYSAEEAMKSEMITEYMYDYFVLTLSQYLGYEAQLTGDLLNHPFIQQVKKVGNDNNLQVALKNILRSVSESQDIIDTINRLYSPAFKSFKEEYFNEILEDATEVAPASAIKSPFVGGAEAFRRANIATHRGSLPMHKEQSFGPKVFGGETVPDLRDLERGKFFVERYYKFSPEFVNDHINGTLNTILTSRLIQQARIDGNSTAFPDLRVGFLTERASHQVYQGVFSKREYLDLLGFLQSLIRADERDIIDIALSDDRNRWLNSQKLWIAALADNMKQTMISVTGSTIRGLRLVFCPGLMTGVDLKPFKYDYSVMFEGDAPPELPVIEVEPKELARQMAKKIVTGFSENYQSIAAQDLDLVGEEEEEARGLNSAAAIAADPNAKPINTIKTRDVILQEIGSRDFWYGKDYHNLHQPRAGDRYFPGSDLVFKTRSYIGNTTIPVSRENSLLFHTDFANNVIENNNFQDALDKMKRLSEYWLMECIDDVPRSAAITITSLNESERLFRPALLYGVPMVGAAQNFQVQQAGFEGAGVGSSPDTRIFLSTTKPLNIMFPTPMAHQEMPACQRDVWTAIEGLFEANQWQDQSLEETHLREINAIIKNLDDELVKEAFGMDAYNQDEGKREKTSQESTNMGYIFDFIFPLDRYQAMFMIYTQNVLDLSPDIIEILLPTRKMCQKMVQALANPDVNKMTDPLPLGGASNYNAIMSDMTSNGLGDAAMAMIPDVGKIVQNLFKTFIPRLVRTVAGGLDPAYKDLKKTFDKDPRASKAGLTLRSLKIEPDEVNSAQIEVKDGLTPKKTFVPMNVQGPIDISIAGGKVAAGMMMPFGSGIGLVIEGTNDLLTVVERLENSVTKRTSNRYGSLLTPLGIMAMGLSELSGERYRDKIKKDPEQVFKVCDDNKPAGKPDPQDVRDRELRDSINNKLGE